MKQSGLHLTPTMQFLNVQKLLCQLKIAEVNIAEPANLLRNVTTQ